MKRLALLAVAGASLLLLAPAAQAATPTGTWTDPAPSSQQGGVPLAYLQRAQKLAGHADFAANIASVTFGLAQDAANTGAGDPCSAATTVRSQSISPNSPHVDFAFDAPFPCNRKYEVRATVTPAKRTLQNDTPLVLDLWVGVAIPPSPTTGLTAKELSGDARGVQLSWSSVPHEPDFLGYEIRKAEGTGAFSVVTDVGATSTSWVDSALPRNGGTVRYQVVGMRPGPEVGTTVFADAANISTTVSPAPATTTPPAGDGSGGSAGGGSSGSSGGGGLLPPGAGVPQGHAASPVHTQFTVPGPNTTTTLDTGFKDTLPFKQRQQSGSVPGAENSAIARLPDSNDDSTRPKVVLVAGAGVTFSWAMLLRFLTRRAAAL